MKTNRKTQTGTVYHVIGVSLLIFEKKHAMSHFWVPILFVLIVSTSLMTPILANPTPTHANSKEDPLKELREQLSKLDIYLAQGQGQALFKLIDELQNKYPEDAMVLGKLGLIYLKCGKRRQAMKKLDAALAKDAHEPSAVATRFFIATLSFENKRINQARELLDAAMKTYPQAPQLHAQLGIYFGSQKQFNQAISCLNKAIECCEADPTTPMYELSEYELQLAGLYVTQNQSKPIIRWMTAALEHRDHDPKLWLTYISTLHDIKEEQKAIDEAKKFKSHLEKDQSINDSLRQMYLQRIAPILPTSAQ